jgi:hypothetical protein
MGAAMQDMGQTTSISGNQLIRRKLTMSGIRDIGGGLNDGFAEEKSTQR